MFRARLYTYRLVAGFTEQCWVPVLPVALPAAYVGPICGKALDFLARESIRNAKEAVRDKVPFLH
jgi:hypothetical protein